MTHPGWAKRFVVSGAHGPESDLDPGRTGSDVIRFGEVTKPSSEIHDTTDHIQHEEPIERARKRVEELRAFGIDRGVYLIVHSGLILPDLAHGDGLVWAYLVALGWDIDLSTPPTRSPRAV